MNAEPQQALIRVWDFPTRVFHWSLVLLVAFSGISGEFADDLGSDFMEWHKLSGYAILTLLLFRVVWGLVGSTYARFTNFVRGPSAALAYVKALTAKHADGPLVGHNPLGGWSVVLMLAVLSTQVGTGLFLFDDDLHVEGPLAKLVSNATSDLLHEVHETAFVILLTLIVIHVAAIAFYTRVKGENLVIPMITGIKRVPAAMASATAKGGSMLLGAVVLAIAAAAVWLLVTAV